MDMDIVVIDDDAVVLFLHKILIQKSELPSSVHDFKSAAEAFEYIHGQNSAKKLLLVFLDINMPEMNGWEFLDKLQKRIFKPNILVVMVTSSINESDREKATTYPGIIGFIEKPLSTQDCNEIHLRVQEITSSSKS